MTSKLFERIYQASLREEYTPADDETLHEITDKVMDIISVSDKHRKTRYDTVFDQIKKRFRFGEPAHYMAEYLCYDYGDSFLAPHCVDAVEKVLKQFGRFKAPEYDEQSSYENNNN